MKRPDPGAIPEIIEALVFLALLAWMASIPVLALLMALGVVR